VIIQEEKAHVLPKDLPWDEAVLIEPFTIGAQACYRGNVQKGDYVLVMGAGTIGLTAAINAKLAGATVMISDLVDDKLEYAKKCGIDFAVNAKNDDIVKKCAEITGGMGPNVTIDAVCIKSSFEQAVSITSAAGRIVELSFNEIASEIAPVNIVKKELTICGSRLQTHRFPVVIDYLKQKKLPLAGFVTRVYQLHEMLEAFDYVDKNNAAVRKLVISFE
jgi:L-gulonate 5-dehydrogenase